MSCVDCPENVTDQFRKVDGVCFSLVQRLLLLQLQIFDTATTQVQNSPICFSEKCACQIVLTDRILMDLADRVLMDLADRVLMDLADRVLMDLADRVLMDLADRVLMDLADRVLLAVRCRGQM